MDSDLKNGYSKTLQRTAVIFGCSVTGLLLLIATCLPSTTYFIRHERRGHLLRIDRYFKEIAENGYEIDGPNEPDRFMKKITGPETWIWKIKPNDEKSWEIYIWETFPVDSKELNNFGTLSEPSGEKKYLTILLPVNEGALKVQKKLGLPLPPNFSLEDLNENYDPFSSE